MDQISLFSDPEVTQKKPQAEIWVCQRTVKLGRSIVRQSERVRVISRQIDSFTSLPSISLLHLETDAHINTIESFFIKYFYLLTKKGELQ